MFIKDSLRDSMVQVNQLELKVELVDLSLLERILISDILESVNLYLVM